MNRGRKVTGFVNGGGRRRSEEFSLSEDGSKFYYGKPNEIKAENDLLKDYKTSLKCFGGYSEDEEQNFWNDKTFLSFLNTKYLPQDDSKEKVVNLDLNTAKDNEIPYSGTIAKSSENFFSWIVSNMDNVSEVLSFETKFIYLKNVFAKLLKIPYAYALDLDFYAVYSNGIIFLLNHKNVERYELEPQISRWGHKFQQFLTYGENVEKGVVCNQAYRCIMRAKLGPHNLLFSASTDCFDPDSCDFEISEPTSSILLKCCYDNPNNTISKNIERFKMYEWCVSLASLNMPHVLVGLRTKDGIVNLLKLYTEEDLRQCGKEFWDINVGFTFAKNVLSFIEKTTKAKPGTVFSFAKRKFTSYIKAEETEMEDFPPKWFTEEIHEAFTSKEEDLDN